MHTLSSVTVLGVSASIQSIIERIDTVASSTSSVLLIGETGVGKELFAEYIHRTSSRSMQPLIRVGLSALPPELLESELFGHMRGAFTSAVAEKKGLFELADGGTIFLDDIDDFPYPLQAKLLRVLESGELLRVGGTRAYPIDVRLISASKVDLRTLVSRGLFRTDLFYRLNVVPIVIPPLRQRSEDIPTLVQHFLKKYSPDKSISIDDEAMQALVRYSWPGNVRELRNTVQRIVLFSGERICLADLPVEIRDDQPMENIIRACSRCLNVDGMTFDSVIECLESNLIHQAIAQAQGNKSQAAKHLGMNLSTLRDKLKKYGDNSHDIAPA